MFTNLSICINMYLHGIDVYIPFCQILSMWSGFQMSGCQCDSDTVPPSQAQARLASVQKFARGRNRTPGPNFLVSKLGPG